MPYVLDSVLQSSPTLWDRGGVPDTSSQEIVSVQLRGIPNWEGVMEFRSSTGTLVVVGGTVTWWTGGHGFGRKGPPGSESERYS